MDKHFVYVSGAVMLLMVIGFGAYSYFTQPKIETAFDEFEPQTGEIVPLYFFSYGAGSTTVKCVAAKDINWDLAIIALSDYMQYGEGKGEDLGPAEIQQNFEENCDRNMAIYNKVVALNPQLMVEE